jgi:hypothetical protein
MKTSIRLEFAQLFKLNLWYFLNKLVAMGLQISPIASRKQTAESTQISQQHQQTAELYSKIDRHKLVGNSEQHKNNNESIYDGVKMSTSFYAENGEEVRLISRDTGNYDNSDYLIPNAGKRIYMDKSNDDSRHLFDDIGSLLDKNHEIGENFPIYENYKSGN